MGDLAQTQARTSPLRVDKPKLKAVEEKGKEDALTTVLHDRFGFPKQDGYSMSHWLQGVQGDALLDHRTTPDMPPSADIVIIGSGVSTPPGMKKAPKLVS
jgi:hypothetical protein